MKRILLLSALVCMFAGMAKAQERAAVISAIDSAVFDFGNVKEADGPVSHVFKLKNTGEAPLVITSANASCGCTTPEWTKEPIAPGKSGEIKVTYNVVGRPGQFTKTINVVSNVKTGTYVLTIKGNVIPKQQ